MSVTAFRRGEGDKRYSKWIETRRYWRGELYVRTAGRGHLEAVVRHAMLTRHMPVQVRRIGAQLKMMAIRRKK